MRILAIQIANGFGPEARDKALFFANCGGSYQARVLHHMWPGDRVSADCFEKTSGASVVRLDMGWRPNHDGRRSTAGKVLSHLRLRGALPTLLKHARQYAPDVVYSSQQRWDSYAATFLARALRKPQVVHLHYNVGPWLGSRVLHLLRECNHVVAVSDFIREQALRHGVAAERVTRIWNPIPAPKHTDPDARAALRTELGLAGDATLIGIVARLDPMKGQVDSILAFGQLASRFPAAHLVIVGGTLTTNATTQTELRTLAAAKGLTGRVHVLGPRKDVERILDGLDLFIHPSREEPFGLAVAEASAAGLPVVGYDNGGTREIVIQRETGLLAPLGDVDQLAKFLEQLLEQPDAARAMGALGKQRATDAFAPARVGRSFAAVFTQIVRESPPTLDLELGDLSPESIPAAAFSAERKRYDAHSLASQRPPPFESSPGELEGSGELARRGSQPPV